MRNDVVQRVRQEFGHGRVTMDDLRRLRADGLTLKEIERSVGVSRADVRAAEAGESTYDPPRITNPEAFDGGNYTPEYRELLDVE